MNAPRLGLTLIGALLGCALWLLPRRPRNIPTAPSP